MRLLVLLLAFVLGGWLLFDGLHGFLTGDYVTPSAGEYAGQLGPWSKVVSAVGIEPRSNLMMGIHVGLGAVWLVAMLAWVLRWRVGWSAMFACAVGGLWYLPFGTLLCVLQILLLLTPKLRRETVD